jgi:hypothetical protein
VTELVVEFSSSAYLTDTPLSRLKRIPCYTFTAGEYEKTGDDGTYEFYNERPFKGKVKLNDHQLKAGGFKSFRRT